MKAVVITAGAAAAFAALSYWNYRRFMPAATPADSQTGGTKFQVNVREHSIDANGRRIYGELLTPVGKEGKLPTVICCHGYGSSYKLCKNMIAKSFAMSGYAVYVFDFCGGSRRTRSSMEMRDMTIFTEKEDLLAVIDYVKGLPEVDGKRLYLLGESQGGMVSAITAVDRKDDIRAMVLYYPAFCIPEDAHRKFQTKEEIPDEVEAFKIRIGGNYYRSVWDFDVFDYIGGYDGPVLIMHGDRDTVVPHNYGERGAKSYPHAEFETFPGEIHGWTGQGKKKARERSFAFFERNR